MKIFGKEPAVIIATAAALITGVIVTLSGNGFISDAAAGRATDIVEAARQLAVLFLPFLATGLATRSQVFSPDSVDKLTAGSEPVVGGRV